uniref:Uncharacterized protein n=1 Tax=Anguilla anguilla TaxID=7936 RepID=A0A0E9QXA4_ANGAN
MNCAHLISVLTLCVIPVIPGVLGGVFWLLCGC